MEHHLRAMRLWLGTAGEGRGSNRIGRVQVSNRFGRDDENARTRTMTLLNAPEYDSRRDTRNRNLLIAAGVLVVLTVVIGMGGFMLGHGWFFSNLPAEHKVGNFFSALEAKDYGKAFAIYTNDPDWQQHPEKHEDYPLQRFTEDWTTESPVGGPIVSHHVDISKTDGTGLFGSGIIVAVRVNGDHKLFMWYERKDGTLTEPAPHILQYD